MGREQRGCAHLARAAGENESDDLTRELHCHRRRDRALDLIARNAAQQCVAGRQDERLHAAVHQGERDQRAEVRASGAEAGGKQQRRRARDDLKGREQASQITCISEHPTRDH